MAISKAAHKILNDEKLIAQRDLWFQRMEAVFYPQPSEWNNRHVLAVNGYVGCSSHDLYTEPEKWVEDCLEDLAENYEKIYTENYFCPLCVEYGAYGVHYIDKLFGADVFYQDGQWYNRYLSTPVGSLKMPDLDNIELWQTTKRVVEAFLAAEVRLPLFGLPTIASVLNIAVNLYGQEILVEMLIDPEAAQADLNVINNLLCGIHRYFRERIPQQQLQPVLSWARTQPPGHGQLCGCTTQLLSKDLYAEMIAPLDNQLLGVYPRGGMIHLCGSHEQHIETFRAMKNLKAVQLNDRAAEDFEKYLNGLREDQIIYFHPCEKVSVEDAIRLSGGNRLVFDLPLDHPLYKSGV